MLAEYGENKKPQPPATGCIQTNGVGRCHTKIFRSGVFDKQLKCFENAFETVDFEDQRFEFLRAVFAFSPKLASVLINDLGQAEDSNHSSCDRKRICHGSFASDGCGTAEWSSGINCWERKEYSCVVGLTLRCGD